MMEMTAFLQTYLVAALCLMTLVAFVCLLRAAKGPRFTDRVLAMNMIGSLVVMMICILSYVLDEGFLVDVAVLYALLNMLVVVVLCRVANARHREVKKAEKEAQE